MTRHYIDPIRRALLATFVVVSVAGAQDTGSPTEAERAPATKPAKTAQKKGGDFTRFVRTNDVSGHFDTSVATFEDKDGRRVDLIGAVHIGDREYYEGLQETFTAYDAVLYELVAPKGTVPQPGAKSSSVISILQRRMKDALRLEFQLDAIDYSAENFVHADMTPEEFSDMQKERGESIWSIILNSMFEALKNPELFQGKDVSVLDVIGALFTKDGHDRLKLILADQLDNIELMVAGFGKGSVILHERNKTALGVLDDVLSENPEHKKLAIFYGAAHMPDMEQRLVERGFKRTGTRWITAWQIGPKSKKI